ncbi:TonB-dependent siderophore receptor [Cronbergia sp. UHCC 0137]|uniref:TonB-dependent siderophore receptor n=1 Tax=Cronbergia sp. UHCC 0137 TaxID=3110239 RepID=UPI002B1FFB50|nr:TonB-dependent siderophore receptor [Cronbergia sp. UHCC 0137]MEA5619312.1 TonB-dependent siderophore receptor [Cronbergia sp. UHCC 0137]
MAWNSWQPYISVASIITVLVSQPVWATPVPVTAIELYDTDQGLEVVLKTPPGISLNTETTTEENTLIIIITNAQLQLVQGKSPIIANDPIPGIAEIFIEQSDPNTIQIEITGVSTVPKADLRQDGQEFIVSIPLTTISQTPPPTTSENPTPETPTPEEDEPIEITVVGDQFRPTYQIPNSSVGTRTDTPLIDVPQAIQVIPQEVIKDQGVRSLGEVLKNTSSASSGRTSSQAPALTPVIRGFESRNLLRNGLRDDSLRYSSEIGNVERVEVLKGPASVLFGQGDLGGVVNLVTKQPLDTPYYALEYKVGEFGLHRSTLDFSGPLDQDGIAYRLNAAYQTAESFKKFENSESFFIAPVVRLISNKDTTLIASLEYLKYRSFETAPDLPASGTVISNPNGRVSRDANLGEPSLSKSESLVTRLGYQLDHRLNDIWKIKSELSTAFLDIPENTGVTPISNTATSDGLNADGRTIRRFLIENPSSTTSLTFNNSLLGKFRTGNIEHSLLFGVEVATEQTKDRLDFRQLSAIDIFNPVYRPESVSSFAIPFGNTNTQKNSIGIYAQDQISLSKNIILVLGGRLDFANQNYEDLLSSAESYERSDTVFSPRVGLVYKPSENLSLYGSYSKSFTPVVGRTRVLDVDTGITTVGEPFEPEKGTQYEIGLKANLLGDRLSTTLAFYNLERTNVAAQGLSEPLSQIQIGKQRSQGIELDVAGEILPGWNLTASYAYTDTEITEDSRAEFDGKQLQNVPKNAFGLWSTYELQSGNLKGLGMGLGVFTQGERQGDLRNTFTLPSYWRTDASIFYRRDKFRAAINIQNLLDENYYEGARDIVRIVPGAPFTLTGSISVEF